jgi:hypothetical protein
MKKFLLVCSLMVALGLSAGARADIISLAYVGVDAGGDEAITLNGQGYSGANGLMAVNTKDASGPLASLIASHTWTYCMADYGHYADFSYSVYSVGTLDSALGTDKAALIDQLWAQHHNSAWEADTYIYYGGNNGGWTAGEPGNTLENQQALAMVLAISEIRHDFISSLSDLNLSAGNYVANSANPGDAIGIAASWLSALVMPSDYTGPQAQLLALMSDDRQDMITVEVPEPMTLAVLGLGGLLLRRRMA